VVVVAPPPHRPVPPPTVVYVPVKEPRVNVGFTIEERRVIQQYTSNRREEARPHGHKAKSLPPGLAKKAARGGSLPPGWQKKLAKGEIMPLEVFHQCDPLPQEVVVLLPPPPHGTVLVTIEGRLVRLLQATREILDVLEVPL